jgi:phytoene dehydrogenase-like protein
VEKILVEGDRAVGVRLEDGTEYRADYVISAADGRTTIFDMLEGRYVDDKTRQYYAGELPIFEPLLYLSFGVDGAFEEAPHYLTFNFASPLRVADEEVRRATYRVYNFDPTLAPPGKVTIIVSFESRYDYWKNLYEEDRDRYREEKDRLATAVLDELERRLPGIKNKVEVVDVATPVTFERYTADAHAADGENAARPGELLDGRPMGPTGGRRPDGAGLRPASDTAYLSPGGPRV